MSNQVKYLNLTPDNFKHEIINSDHPVLVDFWAAWCGPCRVMNPIIESIAENFEGRIKVTKADVEQNQEVATEYNIQAIPTILIFQQGEIVERLSGIVSQTELEKKLEYLTQNASVA